MTTDAAAGFRDPQKPDPRASEARRREEAARLRAVASVDRSDWTSSQWAADAAEIVREWGLRSADFHGLLLDGHITALIDEAKALRDEKAALIAEIRAVWRAHSHDDKCACVLSPGEEPCTCWLGGIGRVLARHEGSQT